MSKQSSAKEQQGYTRTIAYCGNCKHFKSDIEKEIGRFGESTTEKNLRCGIGGFKVHKTATCKLHEFSNLHKKQQDALSVLNTHTTGE